MELTYQVAILIIIGTLISEYECVPYVEKDIRDFGAEGDGVSWDHYAFNAAAAYFNARGGNGKLTISPGCYMVGKQIRGTPGQTGAWVGYTVMDFSNLQNFTITGVGMPKIKYLKGLRFGSFDPTTGDAIAWGGTDPATRGDIGSFITMYNSLNIEISNLEIDGNSPTMILGGGWGDVGRQLGHDAIDLVGNMNVLVSNIHAHHFGKDGMQVGTYANPYPVLNHTVQDCRFESNGRQGMSWIGGTGLRVLRSSFNHQGSGAPGLNSPPGAGFDVEQEMALNRDAYFEGNEFLNNAGCQFVADSGDSAGIYMKNNVLWGVNGGGWSWWVVKPDVVFTDGQIFGSTVHGYSTTNYSLSTRHFHTYFSDPLWYDGRWTVSDFLLNINNVNMLHYERSTFITTWRKPMWSSGNGPESPLLQHQILYSNIFINISDAAGQWDYGYIIRGTRVKGDRLEWSFGKQHFYAAWGGNIDSGGTFGVTSPDNTTNQWQ